MLASASLTDCTGATRGWGDVGARVREGTGVTWGHESERELGDRGHESERELDDRGHEPERELGDRGARVREGTG